MGWSCSAVASDTMQKIEKFCIKSTGMQNVYEVNGMRYFVEYSRKEHADGAVTGDVMKISKHDGTATRTGRIRIEGDGKISTGPAILKKLMTTNQR